jgi:hypothetical protein
MNVTATSAGEFMIATASFQSRSHKVPCYVIACIFITTEYKAEGRVRTVRTIVISKHHEYTPKPYHA